jgi:glycosyltransferase involved in cell wall biosynthesis
MSPSSTERKWPALVSRRLVEWAIRFLSSRDNLTFTFETTHDRNQWVDDGLVTKRNSVVICGAGVNPKHFFPRPASELQLPLSILFASRLLRSKGLDVFVQVARRLSDRGVCRFIVAGMIEPHDPDGYSVQQLAREPAIEFLGEIRDMPDLLRSVDIVCLPSRYGEGIPRILIEASATGLPCIATDLAGCQEIVRHGQTGILCPVGPEEEMIQAFAAAVTGYTSEPALAARHGRAAFEFFRNGEFSEESVVSHFVTLLTAKPEETPHSVESTG